MTSPDGSMVAYRRVANPTEIGRGITTQIVVRSISTGHESMIRSAGSGSPSWSPDGRALVYRVGAEIQVVPVEESGRLGKPHVRCRSALTSSTSSPAWGPGRAVLIVEEDKRAGTFNTFSRVALVMVDLDTCAKSELVRMTPSERIADFDYDATRRHVVATTETGRVLRWSPGLGRTVSIGGGDRVGGPVTW